MILDETPDRLGSLTAAAGAALGELVDRDAVARTWSRDHTLWRDDPTEIGDRLGWLTVVPDMVTQLDAVRATCARLAAGVDHVLLAGMGGSSLFPEVIARSARLGSEVAGAASLHVLDTTDPAAVARLGAELPPDRTLQVAASKSGTTLETRSHLAWGWQRHPDPARFAVITDPGSELARLAEDRRFAAVFENPPDIGGRYSALSLFGLVPALVAAPADVDDLLASASGLVERLRTSPRANSAARLAAAIAGGVRSGRDKLTLVVPDGFATFGLWLEQLLAESTGKDGTGVVPVVGEPLGEPTRYGDDRLFVALGEPGTAIAGRLDALAEAGHPVVVLPFGGTFADLGGQVLLWELATAMVGALLGIHPFDQPDVAAAKAATNQVLEQGPPDLETTPLDDLLGQMTPGDYLAIQAFVDPGSPVVDQIDAARVVLRDRLGVATTVGLGPRFLHSTGQLHKGGPNTGVFVQVVGDDPDDVPIPGQTYGFSALKHAQADGDLVTLRDRKRRAGRVALDQLLEVAGP
ncbi:MAG: glucose-6-phosphate isomerase [Acidimicrobiales bacterium]